MRCWVLPLGPREKFQRRIPLALRIQGVRGREKALRAEILHFNPKPI